MDLKQIRELIAAMEKGGVKRLSIKEKSGLEIELERQEEGAAHPPSYPVYPAFAAPHRELHVVSHPPAHRPLVEEKGPEKEAVISGIFVTSPMVGTFYQSPSPDDPPFAKVGDTVDENSVVCIIEAMKVMNEVKAGKKGVIAEICLTNAHPVEFGTKLFRIT